MSKNEKRPVGKEPRVPVEEVCRLDELEVHPLQRNYYRDLPGAQLDALAESIERSGQRHAIEALPVCMRGRRRLRVLDGHQRWRALAKLGRPTARVLVRYELAGATDDRLRREFFEPNLTRRQMPLFAQIRVDLELLAIRRAEVGEQSGYHDARYFAELAAKYAIDVRTLNRYRAVARAPAEVQAAFEDGRLKLTLADRVAGLDRGRQAEIARRLRAGEDPAAVVRGYLPRVNRSRQRYSDLLARGMTRLGEFTDLLDGQARPLTSRRGDLAGPLARARAVIDRLLAEPDE